MSNILFISYNHGNDNFADSIQNKRLTDLLKNDANFTVLTRSKKLQFDKVNIISVRSLNLFYLDVFIYKLFPFLFPVFSIDKILWGICAYVKLLFLNIRFSSLLITYEPYSLRFLASLLKKNVDSIISILYDPGSVNLFFPQSKIARLLQKKAEKNIISKSDIIILNNVKTFDFYSCTYSEYSVRFRNIPLCSSLEPLPREGVVDSEQIKRIIFAGNLHGCRSLYYLNAVVGLLKEKYSKLHELLHVDFYGSMRIEDFNITRSNHDVIRFHGFLPQELLAEKMSEANAFLLIEAMDGTNYSFPSKILDYFSYSKLILAFTTNDSAVYEELVSNGHIACSHQNWKSMVDFIDQLILKNEPVEYLIPNNYKLINIKQKYSEILL